MQDFFSFRKMLTPVMIKILYIAGSIGIVITSFVFMVKVIDFNASLGFFTSLGVLISGAFGFLVWRMICEYVILMFSLHSELVSFRKDYNQQDVSQPRPYTAQPVYNPQTTYTPPASMTPPVYAAAEHDLVEQPAQETTAE